MARRVGRGLYGSLGLRAADGVLSGARSAFLDAAEAQRLQTSEEALGAAHAHGELVTGFVVGPAQQGGTEAAS